MKFDFFFGVSLGALILRHSDNLSKSLRHKTLSAAEGQHIAKLTLTHSGRSVHIIKITRSRRACAQSFRADG